MINDNKLWDAPIVLFILIFYVIFTARGTPSVKEYNYNISILDNHLLIIRCILSIYHNKKYRNGRKLLEIIILVISNQL